MKKGEVIVMGIGLGKRHLTPEVEKQLKRADIIMGHESFIEQVKDKISSHARFIDDSELRKSCKDVEELRKKRTLSAIKASLNGRTVAFLCGGDPGLFSYAEPLIIEGHKKRVNIQVVSNIPYAIAAAAKLGAPLREGFAVIALYEARIPIRQVLEKLELATIADFVIVLHYPKHEAEIISEMFPEKLYPELYPLEKKCVERLFIAQRIMLKHKKPETPVGIVTFSRDGEPTLHITKLSSLLDYQEHINPYTTIIIGNSRTRIYGKKMVTVATDRPV